MSGLRSVLGGEVLRGCVCMRRPRAISVRPRTGLLAPPAPYVLLDVAEPRCHVSLRSVLNRDYCFCASGMPSTPA